jgi:hypothetical protein
MVQIKKSDFVLLLWGALEISTFFFFFWWHWGLNLVSCLLAATLPFGPLHQPLEISRIGFCTEELHGLLLLEVELGESHKLT